MTMYRATQNRNEPNLPFAQSLSPTMFRDNQNPNEPNLPFSQSRSSSIKFGGSTVYVPTTDQVQGTTRNGYGTEIKQNDAIWKHIDKLYAIHGEQEGRITDAYKHRLQIEKTAKTAAQKQGVDYGADIRKLYAIHGEQEGRITAGYEHRLGIESKVDEAKAEHQNIWDRTDFAKHDHGHGGGNGNGCDTWDIMCHIDKLKAQIGGAALLGGVAIVGYVLLKKRMKL